MHAILLIHVVQHGLLLLLHQRPLVVGKLRHHGNYKGTTQVPETCPPQPCVRLDRHVG